MSSSVGAGLLSAEIWNYLRPGLEATDIPFYVLDREHRILYMSPAAAQALEIRSEDAVGRTSEEAGISSDVIAAFRPHVDEVIRGRKALHGEAEFQLGLRRLVIEHLSLPIFGPDNEPQAAAVFLFDRTEQVRERKVLEALVRVNDLLKSMDDTSSLASKTVEAVAGSLSEDGFALVIRRGEVWTTNHSMDLTTSETKELGAEAIRLADMVIKAAEMLNIADATKDPRINADIATKYRIGSLLIVPAEVGREIEGALLFTRCKEQPFTVQEVVLAEKLAASISVAMNEQVMFEGIKQANVEKEDLLSTIARERDMVTKVFDATPVSIGLFEGEDGRLTMCNENFRNRVFPSARRPLEGRRLSELATPEEASTAEAMAERALRTGEIQVVLDHIHHTGEQRERHDQLIITALSQQPPSFLLVATDITEVIEGRKRIEELAAKAEAERSRLRTIINNLPVGILLVDASGMVTGSNEFRDEVWDGKVPTGRFPDGLKTVKGRWSNTGIAVPREGWPIMRALNKGEVVRGEMIDIQRLDGRQGTELVSAAPINDGQGNRIGAVGILQDITEQRRLEHEAIEAKERAEMYLDLLTHDISNHNAAITSYIQLAMVKDKQGRKKSELQKALDAVSTCTELIDTVRKIQLVETHDTAHSLVDLGWMLDDVIGEVKALGGERTDIEYRPLLRRFVMASPLLKDAFLNILANAVKHSEEEVDIKVTLTKAFDGGREYHKVIVEDNGPGIEDEVKLQIFQRKYRGRTKASGSGLGLYLVKRLVEEHGGRVWVEDRVPGDHAKGAKFIVLLPAVAVTRSTEA